jgi:hypothetical protein
MAHVRVPSGVRARLCSPHQEDRFVDIVVSLCSRVVHSLYCRATAYDADQGTFVAPPGQAPRRCVTISS